MDPEELETLSPKEVVAKLVELLNDADAKPDDVDDVVDWFLFAYSPEENFSIIEDNTETLKDIDLLMGCMTKCKNSYQPDIFLEFVNLLSALEGFEIEMAKAESVQAIVMMMAKDDSNPRTQVLGCKALGNLARNSAVRDWIGKCRAIQRVLSALERHKDKPESVLHFLGGLVNITYKSSANKKLFMNLKGIDQLLAILQQHKKSMSICMRCLAILRNMTAEKMVMELHQHTILRVVTSTMELHKTNATLQTHGLWTLINLMSGDVDIKKYIASNFTTAIDRILAIMEAHQANPTVQLAATTAMALLSRVAAARSQIVKNHGISRLLSVMSIHRENVSVQRAVIKTLYRLAANGGIREELGKAGVVTEVIKTMKRHTSHIPLQRIGCICLTQLAKSLRQEILEKDAIPLFSKATLEFQGNPLVEPVARKAMDAVLNAKNLIHEEKKTDGNDKPEDAEQLRAELAAARKQLAEKAKLLANTQKKLDQSEGDKVKYKNQLRNAEKKLKKLVEVNKGPTTPHNNKVAEVPATVAKSSVLAEIKAKKQQLDSDKQITSAVQANKSAVLEQIKLKRKDEQEIVNPVVPEIKIGEEIKMNITPPNLNLETDKESEELKSEEDSKSDSGPIFSKNIFSIMMEGDIKRSIPYDPFSKLKDHLEPIAKAREINLANWSVSKIDGTVITDLEIQLCSLGVLEIRFLPNIELETTTQPELLEQKPKLIRRPSSKDNNKKLKSKSIEEGADGDPKAMKEAKVGRSISSGLKMLKRKSQPRMPARPDKKQVGTFVVSKPPPPPPAPDTRPPRPAEVTPTIQPPTPTGPSTQKKPKRGSFGNGGSPSPKATPGGGVPSKAPDSPSTTSPSTPSPPSLKLNVPGVPPIKTAVEGRGITRRRAESTPRGTSADRIAEYCEEIEMLKGDLSVMKNVVIQQGEHIKSLEEDRDKLKDKVTSLNGALNKAREDLKNSFQLPLSTPRAEDPKSFSRLQKKNKELQTLCDVLKSEIEQLKAEK